MSGRHGTFQEIASYISPMKGARRFWQFFVVNVPSLFENNTDRLAGFSVNQEATRSGLLQVLSGHASVNRQAHEKRSRIR
jgi:hypothetical protein